MGFQALGSICPSYYPHEAQAGASAGARRKVSFPTWPSGHPGRVAFRELPPGARCQDSLLGTLLGTRIGILIVLFTGALIHTLL